MAGESGSEVITTPVNPSDFVFDSLSSIKASGNFGGTDGEILDSSIRSVQGAKQDWIHESLRASDIDLDTAVEPKCVYILVPKLTHKGPGTRELTKEEHPSNELVETALRKLGTLKENQSINDLEKVTPPLQTESLQKGSPHNLPHTSRDVYRTKKLMGLPTAVKGVTIDLRIKPPLLGKSIPTVFLNFSREAVRESVRADFKAQQDKQDF